MTRSLIRDTQQRRSQEKSEQTGGMWPQARTPGPPRARKSRKDPPPEPLEGQSPADTKISDLGPPELGDRKLPLASAPRCTGAAPGHSESKPGDSEPSGKGVLQVGDLAASCVTGKVT